MIRLFWSNFSKLNLYNLAFRLIHNILIIIIFDQVVLQTNNLVMIFVLFHIVA